MSTGIEALSRSVRIAGEEFPVVDAGNGSAVVLLHGFPDSRHLWRHQVTALLEAGYRVLAPDLRGFGDAPRPAEVAAYRRPRLVMDVIGLLDALGVARAHLVGHDFGASLAWTLAGTFPDRFDRLVALSVGVHGSPGWKTVAQREKSWYFDFFQKTGLAEAELQAQDWALLRALLRGQGDVDRYLRDLARPGALTAALNWYRATFGPPPDEREPAAPLIPRWHRLPQDVMGVWSEHDPLVLEPQMTGSEPAVAGRWRYERLTDAGHWMMLDQPARVNALLLDFLRT